MYPPVVFIDEYMSGQAKFFTESRLLQRPVRVQILSLPTSTATPFQTGTTGSAPQQLASLLAKVRSNAKFFTLQNSCLRSVLHPAGNVAEFLVAAGLARIVDWHAGMLSSSGGMERLRAAEKAAKEKRACLYAGVASSTSKTNGGAADGNKRVFEATVIRVWNGDQISVVEKDTGKERKLQLSSTRGPK